VSDRDLTQGDPLRRGGAQGARQAPAADRPAPRWQEVPPTGGDLWSGDRGSPAAPALVLSGWWRRAGAAVIDAIIVGAVAIALMAPLGIGLFASDGDGSGVVAFAVGFFAAALVVTVVAFLYAPLLMARTNGQTLGRMATGIRVVRTNGEPMTFGLALLREVVVKGLLINTVGGSLTFGLAGLLDVLWPLWDEENRALHDFVVQTRTVLVDRA
jgi:uncharacterized RDD family membrane protein YckC